MDIVAAIKIFEGVVEGGSFSAAGRRLRLSRSVVSRYIEGLEAELGIRLINRTTRRLSLTDAGRKYHEGARNILRDLQKLQVSLVESEKMLKGTLRVSAPVHFGEWKLLPIVTAFLKRYPEIDVTLELSNRRVDIIEDGFDVIIRTAPTLDDSSYIARRISTNRLVPCASAAYCKLNGQPQTPEELTAYHCIASLQHAGTPNWVFVSRDGTLLSVPISARFTVNAGPLQIKAVKAGLGIALLPEYLVEAEIRSGELVRLLPNFEHQSYPVYVIYPHKKFLPLRTRKFLDLLKELT